MEKRQPDISIIVPVYNSAGTIPELLRRVDDAMKEMGFSYEVILSDDCSPDESWNVICLSCGQYPNVGGVKLAVNSGQWANTLAGISRARGKLIVTIDDDLEYDPHDIKVLYSKLTSGNYKIVFGMAKEKYMLQGKNHKLSNWRKNFLISFWRTYPTDSYKIFYSDVVFDANGFRPNVLLDAYLSHEVDVAYWGYCQVAFNKRYMGSSNHSVLRKMRLFFLYTRHYWQYPWPYMFYLFFIFLIIPLPLALQLYFTAGYIYSMTVVFVFLISGAVFVFNQRDSFSSVPFTIAQSVGCIAADSINNNE